MHEAYTHTQRLHCLSSALTDQQLWTVPGNTHRPSLKTFLRKTKRTSCKRMITSLISSRFYRKSTLCSSLQRLMTSHLYNLFLDILVTWEIISSVMSNIHLCFLVCAHTMQKTMFCTHTHAAIESHHSTNRQIAIEHQHAEVKQVKTASK